jgi:hypothetical protein
MSQLDVTCFSVFCELCYNNCRAEVMGQNLLQLLQGPRTDLESLQQLREALSATPPVATTVTVLAYK